MNEPWNDFKNSAVAEPEEGPWADFKQPEMDAASAADSLRNPETSTERPNAVALNPAQLLGEATRFAGKSLYGGLADIGSELLGQRGREVRKAAIAGEEAPPTNIEQLVAGEPMSADVQKRFLPMAPRMALTGAQGLIETTPQLAATGALTAAGVPAPIAAGAVFGSTPEGFDVKQGAVAAALPFVGKYSGEIVGTIAKKYGVNSTTALNWLKGIAGTLGPAGYLGTIQESEIENLPENQRKDARIDAIANIAGMSALGPMGVKFEAPRPFIERGNEVGTEPILPSSKPIQPVSQERLSNDSANAFRGKLNRIDNIGELRKLENDWTESIDDPRQQHVLELLEERKSEISKQRKETDALQSFYDDSSPEIQRKIEAHIEKLKANRRLTPEEEQFDSFLNDAISQRLQPPPSSESPRPCSSLAVEAPKTETKAAPPVALNKETSDRWTDIQKRRAAGETIPPEDLKFEQGFNVANKPTQQVTGITPEIQALIDAKKQAREGGEQIVETKGLTQPESTVKQGNDLTGNVTTKQREDNAGISPLRYSESGGESGRPPGETIGSGGASQTVRGIESGTGTTSNPGESRTQGVRVPQLVEYINKRDVRDWSKLPASFQQDSVRAAFQDIKGLFPKKAISERVRASKATTFSELRQAVDDAIKKHQPDLLKGVDPNETAPEKAPVRDWDLYYENLVGDLDAFSPARHTGKRNYELNDMAQRFVDYAQNDKSGKSLVELVNEFAKIDESSQSQLRKLKVSVKSLEAEAVQKQTKTKGGEPTNVQNQEKGQTQGDVLTIEQAALDWKKAEKRLRRAQRQDKNDLADARSARDDAEVNFRALAEQSGISKEAHDKFVQEARATETQGDVLTEAPVDTPVEAVDKAKQEVNRIITTEGSTEAKVVKSQLVQELEKLVADAPNLADATTAEHITIDIPGDGTFKVRNEKKALEELLVRAKRIKTNSTSEPTSAFSKVRPTGNFPADV